MKKLAIIALCSSLLFAVSSANAAIKFGAIPEVSNNGKDYVGEIVGADYGVSDDSNQILIMTSSDDKNNESNLKGAALAVDGKDLPFGLTLANSVGKKIAVLYDANYNISRIEIITDKYWNGTDNIMKQNLKR